MSDKQREWWIAKYMAGGFQVYDHAPDKDEVGDCKIVHVIEYAAFEKIKAENDKLLTEVMSLRLQKDPDIVDGVKDVTIAALKNTETRVRADRDKIREERDTIKAKLAEVEAEATSLKDQLAWSIKNENMYKAETHTALINLERMREQLSDCGALYESAKDTFKELVREREVANVLREAVSLAKHLEHKERCLKEYGGTCSTFCRTYSEALSKATAEGNI